MEKKTTNEIWAELDGYFKDKEIKGKTYRVVSEYDLNKMNIDKEWVSVEDLLNHIKNMPDNNVKSELMSLFGGVE